MLQVLQLQDGARRHLATKHGESFARPVHSLAAVNAVRLKAVEKLLGLGLAQAGSPGEPLRVPAGENGQRPSPRARKGMQAVVEEMSDRVSGIE